MPRDDIVLTLDADWAPDFVIADGWARIAAAGLAATCFMTNPVGLAPPPGIEIGIHPNLLPGSTQGADTAEILDRLTGWFPEARSVRTHGLAWAPGLVSALPARGLVHDASLMLPFHSHLAPVRVGGLTRIAGWWSDNIHLMEGLPFRWDALATALARPGLKVLTVHFIHVYLNTPSLDAWARTKAALSGPLETVPETELAAHRHAGAGLGTLFDDLLAWARETGAARRTLAEVLEGTPVAGPS